MFKGDLEQYRYTPACLVENYSYRHPFVDEWALTNIGFDLQPGESLAVFGESGSGKTTLLSSLTGLNHHFYHGGEHKGSIDLFGMRIADTDIFALARTYGLVTQDFRNQLLANQVEGAIAFSLENRAIPHEQMHGRVQALLEQLHLTEVATHEVSTLSGGQGQRVVVASMLAKEPRLMIFDDIASDLDPRGQDEIKQIITSLKRQGITMIIVDSSDPLWLLDIADKALVLQKGHQMYFGHPEGIRQNLTLACEVGACIEPVRFREQSNSPVAISIENVSFAYDGDFAVRNITATIAEGSITGIIGPNGSGKTTLLKILAGLNQPRVGEVSVDGIKPYSTPADRTVRHVAYMPQSTIGIFFTDTVDKELAYTPHAINLPPAITAQHIGLTGMDDKHPEFLSAGERQRLALGCALSSDPKILLLDEPTKGLNQKERLDLVGRLLGLQQQGKTIVIVSHDWPLIARATNNVLVMDYGRLVRSGATAEVMQDRDFFERIGLPLPW